MSQKLWEAVEHLKCVTFVDFAYAVHIILEVMEEICAFSFQDQDLLAQFVIVFSDCSNLISLFLLTNCLIVKQKGYIYLKGERMVLWSTFERSFLKLISTDEELLSAFLNLQDSLLK